MTEIEPYAPREVAVLSHIDSWVAILEAVADLARKVADTDYVPTAYQGNTAATAATIMFGRELGLPPMTALKAIDPIKGTPALSAEAMRGLIFAAGHDLRYLEQTATRCVMEGKRKGQESWTRVSFTMDEAKQAGDDRKNPLYRSRPTEMLIARCTSRLGRMLFPDCLGGFPSPEDVEAFGESLPLESPATVTVTSEPVVAPAVEAPKSKPKTRKRAATKPLPAAPEPVAEPVADAGPPLPGEAGFEQIGQDAPPADEPVDAELVEDEPEPLRTDAQSKHLFALLRELGIATRNEGLEMIASILGHPVESTKTLSKSQASKVIDALASMKNRLSEMGLTANELSEMPLTTQELISLTSATDGGSDEQA